MIQKSFSKVQQVCLQILAKTRLDKLSNFYPEVKRTFERIHLSIRFF